MMRWIAFFLLLAGCSGCAMLDDMIDGPPPAWSNGPAPGAGCNAPPPVFTQTAEPELLKR